MKHIKRVSADAIVVRSHTDEELERVADVVRAGWLREALRARDALRP